MSWEREAMRRIYGQDVIDRPPPPPRPADEDILAAALDAARRVAWCCSANVMGIPYRERREAMAQLRGALHALDGIDYEPGATRPMVEGAPRARRGGRT